MTKSKTAKITKELQAQSMLERADELQTKNEQFEITTLARTNEELYGILDSVYALYCVAKHKCMRECTQMMSRRLRERGVRVQTNTPALTLFVRYIFNSDRKRAYNYAQTLMAAEHAGIEPGNLATFIKANHGVEECRKEVLKSSDNIKREEKLSQAYDNSRSAFEVQPAITTITIPKASSAIANGAQFVFLIARARGNNEFDVLGAVPKTTAALERAAITEFAKFALDREAEGMDERLRKATEVETAKVIATIAKGSAKKVTKPKRNGKALAREKNMVADSAEPSFADLITA